MAERSDVRLRAMESRDRLEVAELICVSTNYWYQATGKPPIFGGGPAATLLFPDVYEALDPGCCVLAEDGATGRLMGSCFHHPRETHVALGIMNVHPNYFGRGVAGRLLAFVTDLADRDGKPVRLVSSAMNLDSFSLYTRAGFVPRAAYQDMTLRVPDGGMPPAGRPAGFGRVRPATPDDVPAIVALEWHVSHIRRAKDWRYFIDNPGGIWHTLVYDDGAGGVAGVLASVAHPGSNMIGPGVTRDEPQAAALLYAQLDHRRGTQPVWLAPVERAELVRRAYAWGARNCEVHFHQVRGAFEQFDGVAMPTFMPETG